MNKLDQINQLSIKVNKNNINIKNYLDGVNENIEQNKSNMKMYKNDIQYLNTSLDAIITLFKK